VTLSATGSSAANSAERPNLVASRIRRHPTVAFIVRRIVAGFLTLLVVSVLIFLATNILPGNVAEVVLGRNATPATVHKLEHELNIDHPMIDRYWIWLDGVVHGNLGKSAVAVAEGNSNAAITSNLLSPLEDSLILGGMTAVLLIPLTLALGVLAGITAGRKLDHAISIPSLVAGGLPEFVTGSILIYIFFSTFNLLPPVSLLNPGESPFSNVKALILPILTLLAVAAGSGIRQVRAGMMSALRHDCVRFARLNGISERRTILRYAARNALAPSVQIIAQNLQYLVGGIIIVESVFTYPGIGTYLVQAVTTRDVSKVQAASLILAALYIVINIAADLIVVFLVPKLRTEIT
jgi:peptide/nickel transport system permease protein